VRVNSKWSSMTPAGRTRWVLAGFVLVPVMLGGLAAGLPLVSLVPPAAGAAAAAPDFTGGGPWFNSDGRPISIGSLRGKVVGVEMWTAGCENCLNVLPYVKQWYAKYRDRGFVVVGVHTPEFAHEGQVPYVREAIARLGIAYPVVMDNNYRIWNAYHNNYWPALYLIDKHGQIRYTRFGEGEYDATERQIGSLLKEPL
jgi:thiol-disulfide isomerase/thioredoxin